MLLCAPCRTVAFLNANRRLWICRTSTLGTEVCTNSQLMRFALSLSLSLFRRIMLPPDGTALQNCADPSSPRSVTSLANRCTVELLTGAHGMQLFEIRIHSVVIGASVFLWALIF